MNFLMQLVRWELLGFLVGLAAIVVIQLLNGSINTRNMLCGTSGGRTKDEGNISPERVQLLLVTLGAGLYYLTQVASTGTFMEIPQTWPLVMGGSNAIYLSGKVYAKWFAKKT